MLTTTPDWRRTALPRALQLRQVHGDAPGSTEITRWTVRRLGIALETVLVPHDDDLDGWSQSSRQLVDAAAAARAIVDA